MAKNPMWPRVFAVKQFVRGAGTLDARTVEIRFYCDPTVVKRQPFVVQNEFQVYTFSDLAEAQEVFDSIKR